MYISRTPFRVSLFGGGTDVPKYFQKREGRVISMAINKYCYVSCRKLPEIANHKIKLSYSKIESCMYPEELEHPLVATALKDLNINQVEIHYDADLPSRSGLGTSSSFAVGLANSLAGLKGSLKSKEYLADKAIYWERELLKEKGGLQDQIAASFGGFNYIKFFNKSSYSVNPIPFNLEKISELESRLLLVYVPKSRISSNHSVENHLNNSDTLKKLDFINEIAEKSISYLEDYQFDNLGELLDETWKFKKSFVNTSSPLIDEIYREIKISGCIGSKLLGAGGGGFMLAWCKEGERNRVQSSLKDKNIFSLKFKIDFEGSKFLYVQNNN